MMNYTKIMFALAVTAIIFNSCEGINTNDNDTIRSEVWVPIYAQPSEMNNTAITFTTVQPTVDAGKIYIYGQYVIQNEQYKGFHIIDQSNPSNPIKVGFLNVPYSTEISIKNNHIYTNSNSDLVVINIANIMQPTVVQRVPNAFPIIEQKHPPLSNVYFECVDAAKGIVVRWERRTNMKVNCRR